MQELQITGIKVYSLSDGSHPVEDSTAPIPRMSKMILDVETDAGIHGVGVGYLSFGIDTLREAYRVIERSVKGKNPLANETLFDQLLWELRGQRKGFAFLVLSALDIALWDIKGKVAGMPVYQLLGGSKTSIPVYASGGWTSHSTEELVEEVTEDVKQGYKSVKIKVGYARGAEPKEDLRRLAAVRRAVGDDIGIMIDANNAWNAGTAVQFIRRAEEYGLTWFEEPTIPDDFEGLAWVRARSSVPVATGEHEFMRYGARDLVAAKSMDIFQPDICRCGGFTEILKMNHVAQAWNLRLAPHCVDFIHAHLLSASPNGMILERLTVEDRLLAKIFPDAPVPVNGMYEIPDKPGLGVEPDWEFLKYHQDC